MNIIDDYTRRVEMLAYCIANTNVTLVDLATKFKASEPTINRDLKALRNRGIDIHSRKSIITLDNNIDKDKLLVLCKDYLQLKLQSELFSKQIKELSEVTDNFFVYLVMLTQAITENKMVSITYKKADNSITKAEVNPLKLLIASDHDWQLQAVKCSEIIIKTFYLSRIIKLEILKTHCNADTTIHKIDKQFKIVLKFKPEMHNEIFDKIWFDNREIKIDSSSNIILTTNQPITNRLAAWCLTWWENIEVLEPLELKQHITQMVKAFNTSNNILN